MSKVSRTRSNTRSRCTRRGPAAAVVALALVVGACTSAGTEAGRPTDPSTTTTDTTSTTTTPSAPTTARPATTEARVTWPWAEPVTVPELGIASVIPVGWEHQGEAVFAGPEAKIGFGAAPNWMAVDPTLGGMELVRQEELGGRHWDLYGTTIGEFAVTLAQTETASTTYYLVLEMPLAQAEEIILRVGVPALGAFEVVDPEAVNSALTARSVEIEGRTVAYADGGEGQTTVVFEAGLGDGMVVWAPVADAVAESSRVFVYDRAGIGGSEAPGAPRDGHRVVTELRAVLAAAGHEPPYIVVGHSLGGTLMELYARAFPGEVAGLVLVDSRPADYTAACVDALGEAMCRPSEEMLAQEGETAIAEWQAMVLTEEQVLTAPPLGPVPAVVLAAGRSDGQPDTDALWVEAQRRLAESLGAGFVLDEEIGHNIQADRPQLVLDAIDSVIRSIEGTDPGPEIDPADNATPDTESEQS